MTNAPDKNPNMTLADTRNAGYCVRGSRRRCVELGLDFKTFVREGFPVEQMEALEDAEITRSLEFTRARLNKVS